MTKKIIHKILLISLLAILPYTTNANGSYEMCKIKNSPPDVFNQYISDLRKVVSNITSEVSKENTKTGLKKDYNTIKRNIIRAFNTMISWSGYSSYFNFYVVYPIKNEVPYEVWRDYKLLDNETKGLERYLRTLINRGTPNISLKNENICKGVEKCSFNGDLYSVISQIISNNENIKELYRVSILGNKDKFDMNILQIVDDNFINTFNDYYNKDTTKHCSACEGGFAKKIKEAIKKITTWQELGKDSTKEWKEAIAIIRGNLDDRQKHELERKLLQEELSRQGVSARGSQAILNNLDRYNNEGLSPFSYITDTVKYIYSDNDKLKEDLKAFEASISEAFKEKDKISIGDFNTVYSGSDQEYNISKKIAEIYVKELPGAQMQDITNEQLQGRLIDMIKNLDVAIKVLNETYEVSQKICNDQARGLGICE